MDHPTLNAEKPCCPSCGARLCYLNEVEMCWPCGKTWTRPTFASDILSLETREALAALMCEPSPVS